MRKPPRRIAVTAPPAATYPLPIASPQHIERVRALCQETHGVMLGFDDAKSLLEAVAHFIYLTEIEDALRPLRQEIERE